MKFIALVLAFTSFSAFSATVNSAKLDANKENIVVNVTYGGGCKNHTFTLKVGGCMETYPVRCSAELVEKIEGGFDMCEALINKDVVINLAKYRLDESYYARGSLTITGDKTMSGKPSSATVVLP
jgi:hypothetical protein